ncbi:hypothetical protein PO909_011055 [Leuciscus waleckii]
MIGWSNAESSGGMNPGAGTFWHDPSICKSVHPGVISLPSDCGTLLTTGKCKNRAVTVAYVRNSETSQSLSSENMALQCLKDACDIVGCKLDVIPFGKLDFGETSVLDHFYNADIAVVEMTDAFRQPSLFYHMGVRESFSMVNNIILYCDLYSDSLQSLQGDHLSRFVLFRTAFSPLVPRVSY